MEFMPIILLIGSLSCIIICMGFIIRDRLADITKELISIKEKMTKPENKHKEPDILNFWNSHKENGDFYVVFNPVTYRVQFLIAKDYDLIYSESYSVDKAIRILKDALEKLKIESVR